MITLMLKKNEKNFRGVVFILSKGDFAIVYKPKFLGLKLNGFKWLHYVV